MDFIDSSLAEEEEEEEEIGSSFRSLSAPYLAGVSDAVFVFWIVLCEHSSRCGKEKSAAVDCGIDFQEQTSGLSAPQSQNATVLR